MMNKHAVWILGLLACLAPATSFADKIGDPAPPLTVQEWIKGKPVQVKSGTNVYVLVFSTLSRANDFALTNLGNLQKKYQDKGLVVVAISDEPAGPLMQLLQLRGEKIEYSVAADDFRKTTLTYLRAYQQLKLPRAFVVGKEGKVLWYGHPLRDGLDQVVDEIMSGRYNLEQARKRITARERMEQYLDLARNEDERAAKAGRMLLTIHTNDVDGLCDLAFQIATDAYLEKRDAALASEALDRAEKLSPTNTSHIAVIRAILLFQTGKEEEGLARARQALASAQTQEAKEELQSNIRAMEVRLAVSKTNQIIAPAKP